MVISVIVWSYIKLHNFLFQQRVIKWEWKVNNFESKSMRSNRITLREYPDHLSKIFRIFYPSGKIRWIIFIYNFFIRPMNFLLALNTRNQPADSSILSRLLQKDRYHCIKVIGGTEWIPRGKDIGGIKDNETMRCQDDSVKSAFGSMRSEHEFRRDLSPPL